VSTTAVGADWGELNNRWNAILSGDEFIPLAEL